MAQQFKLPDLGEGIHEGEIVKVLVQVGDEIKEDQPILEVETDKATVEIPSPFSGPVTDVRVKQGDLVHVGDVMLVVGDGAAAEVPAREEKAPEPEAKAPEPERKAASEEPARKQPAAADQQPAVKRTAPQREGPVPAAPSTRRLARELGIDLREVPPSGPGGRVTAQDVRAFAEQGPAPEKEAERAPARPTAAPAEVSAVRPSAIAVPELPDFGRWGEVERVPLRSVRRATAKHMALAWSQIPHVSHHDVADVTELDAFRRKYKKQVEEEGGSLTLTVFVIKAVIAALKAFPRFNSTLDADTEDILLKKYYNIGVATDTERGLVVPVVQNTDRMSITELAAALPKLVEKTRSGEITLDEMQGGTFTITNIGPLGGTDFSPIVNYPEVAILGMARASWQPVILWEEGKATYVPRLMLPLILAFDHRVVDGADAARFMNMIIDILKDPERMLMAV